MNCDFSKKIPITKIGILTIPATNTCRVAEFRGLVGLWDAGGSEGGAVKRVRRFSFLPVFAHSLENRRCCFCAAASASSSSSIYGPHYEGEPIKETKK